MINVKFCGKGTEEITEGLELFSGVRGFNISDSGILVDVKKGGEGYSVKGENNHYILTYGKKNEFFRAASMLAGLLEQGENRIDISGKSNLKMCGLMLDCSRRAVPKKETLITLIARIAGMGMNTLMLYTEDVYELKDYPYFGYMRGRYTKAELKEIAYTAKLMGIELIPCIQTLGHLEKALRWEYASGMKDTEDILLIDEEKSYAFIESMIKFWREICNTDKIHIGMDEAENVGLGEYLNRHGFCDRFEIMIRHLKRVLDITEKYGFKPMIWSDMFFKIGSSKRDYYDLNTIIPEWVSDKIPDGVSLVYWDYYHEDKALYKTMLKKHKTLCDKVVFAGCAWAPRGLGPLYGKTFETTFPALSACSEEGIESIFVTIWHDDGGEVNFNSLLPGIQLFAEYNYNKNVNMDILNSNFKLCTGYDAEAFYALDLDSIDAKKRDALGVSKQILFQDVLCGLFDKNNACYDLKSVYTEKLRKLNLLKRQGGMETLFEYYKILLELLIKKCDIGINIRSAYGKKDKKLLLEYLKTLDELYSDYEKYHSAVYKLWHETNKTFGFDRFERRIGGALLRLKTAVRKITEYCNNEIPCIEELEEELLWYGGESTEGMLLETTKYDSLFV